MWDSSTARQAAATVAVEWGAGEPVLLRAGSAVMFRAGPWCLRVTDPVVPPGEAERTAALARWLHSHGFPVAAPAGEVRQVEIQGHRYTVAGWSWMDGATGQASPAELGHLAARLHQTPPPVWLPPFDPLAVTRRRIAALDRLNVATPGEIGILTRALTAASELWRDAAARDADQPVLVHGDLTAGNVITTPAGPVVIDWENTGTGPGVWDAAKLVGGIVRFGRDPTGWRRFHTAYRAHEGPCDGLAGAGELLPIYDIIAAAWTVAGRAIDNDRFGPESRTRLLALENPDDAPQWHILD